MWALPTAEGDVPVVLDSDRGSRSVDVVRERTLCLSLVALKGQGLSQHEVFAIADSWHLWAHLTVEENDFVLEPAPEHQDLVNHAWRFEGAAVLAWALGLVRHLPFPDTPVDSGSVTEAVVTHVARGTGLLLRPRVDLLDAADVAQRCALLHAAGGAPGLHPGVLHERTLAFDWLLPRIPRERQQPPPATTA